MDDVEPDETDAAGEMNRREYMSAVGAGGALALGLSYRELWERATGKGRSVAHMAEDGVVSASVEHSESGERSVYARHKVTGTGEYSDSAEGTLVMRGIDENGDTVAKNSISVSGSSFELTIETDRRWQFIDLVWYQFK